MIILSLKELGSNYIKILPNRRTLTESLLAPVISTVKWNDTLLEKLAGKMAKQITDINKLKRRIDAIKKAIEQFKLNSKANPDKNYVYVTRDEAKTICFEFNSIIKIKETIKENYPRVKVDEVITPVVVDYDQDRYLQKIEERLTNIFNARLAELEQLL